MPKNSKEKIIDNTEDLDNVKVSKIKVKKSNSASKKTESILVDKKSTKSKKSDSDKIDDALIKSKTKKPKKDSKDKKSTTKSSGKSSTKKTSSKKDDTIKKDDKKVSTKKSSSEKPSVKKASSKKNDDIEKEDKKTSKKKAETTSAKRSRSSTKKKVDKISDSKVNTIISEYYDLPYRYNKTVIKLLAQNPNTLFAYWEISDEDRNNFLEKYGERFFYITKPILVVHNLTENYSYEIEINDFANNWYINIDNPKCNYSVELGRRPKNYTEEISKDYLFVTSSNSVETPNDHVLFFKDNDKIYFKNIHTNKYTERVIKPFIKNSLSIYKNINLTSEENYFDFENPSSQNPTSNVMR